MSTLKVGTIQDHTNSNNALLIDSSGRVTEPAKPYLFAGNAGGQNVTPTGFTLSLIHI